MWIVVSVSEYKEWALPVLWDYFGYQKAHFIWLDEMSLENELKSLKIEHVSYSYLCRKSSTHRYIYTNK